VRFRDYLDLLENNLIFYSDGKDGMEETKKTEEKDYPTSKMKSDVEHMLLVSSDGGESSNDPSVTESVTKKVQMDNTNVKDAPEEKKGKSE
jgi:hypothetical protein